MRAGAQAFMGDVAMWTGLVTGTMMIVSPVIFRRLGWKGVAKATPTFLTWTGVPFFAGCIGYSLIKPGGTTSRASLKLLVIVGAVLQVISFTASFCRGSSHTYDLKA